MHPWRVYQPSPNQCAKGPALSGQWNVGKSVGEYVKALSAIFLTSEKKVLPGWHQEKGVPFCRS